MSKVITYIAIISVLIGHSLYAQHRSDEHRQDIIQMLNEGKSLHEVLSLHEKCLTAPMMELTAHFDKLLPSTQMEVIRMFALPVMENTVVSPNELFKIHYDTSASSPHTPPLIDESGNGIPDYIDSVASVFDHVWHYQIDKLGYDIPYIDESGYYHVYVVNMIVRFGRQFYGATIPYKSIDDEGEFSPRFKTYIYIDHKYEGYPTSGLNGMRVTAAHEFHHAIQFGAYGYSGASNTLFFYEITSTWFEDVVYPEINDYYFYLPVLFRRNIYNYPFYHSRSTDLHMYARAIWGLMMERRYGRDIMRQKWEYIKEMHPIDAIDRALRDYGSTLEQDLAEFNLWKFYTGSRARPDKFFIDGADYPMLTEKTPAIQHIGETMFRDVDVQTQTIHYHAIITVEQDTVYFLVCNVENNVSDNDEGFYELTVFSERRPDTLPIGNGLWYRLESNNPSVWKIFPLYMESPVADERISVYPNPFRTGQASSVSFVVDTAEEVDLTIFSSDMRLVFDGNLTPDRTFDRSVVRWNGRDNRDRQVASGVYFYVLHYSNTVAKGKVTLIRE